MKKREVKFVLFKLISVLTVFSLFAGVFSVFPESLSPILEASADNIYVESQPYVKFDANYMKNNDAVKGVNTQSSFSYTTSDGVPVLRLKANAGGNDPYHSFEPTEGYSADVYKYVTILARVPRYVGGRFTIYYKLDVNGKINYDGDRHTGKAYRETEEWQLFVFDMSGDELWSGGNISGIRFDFFEGTNSIETTRICDVAAVILSRTPTDVYNSAFELMSSLYSPVQTISDFTEGELKYFERADGNAPNGSPWLASLDNVLTEKNGNLLYTFKYNDSVAHSNPDPYAGFFYKELMAARGMDASDMLTTADFRYTVMRYRTSKDVGGANMQLFYFANGKKEPTFIDIGENNYAMAPSVNYTESFANDWKSLVVDMAAGNCAEGWKGDFDGFRVDWCSPASKDATDVYMEISDIMFFKSERYAYAFSSGLNDVKLAVSESDELEYVEPYDNSMKLSPNTVLMLPETLENKIANSENAKHYPASNGGVSVTRLETVKLTDDPFVTLDPSGVDPEKHKYVTIAVRTNVSSGAALKFSFVTDKSDGVVKDYVISRYKKSDEWQLVTVDLEDVAAWSGDVSEIKLTYLYDDPYYTKYEKGTLFDIAGIAFSETADDYYDSAYYLLSEVYRPEQVLTGFTDSDIPAFSASKNANGGLSDTVITVKNGDLRYDLTDDYKDPFGGFFYKDLMDIRGVAAADRLTTEDFSSAVIRYSTSSHSRDPRMQLFLYTNNNYHAMEADSLSKRYSTTQYGTWNSICFDFKGTSTTSDVWYGDFNGFRLDWCGAAYYGEYIEISEIMFFEDEKVADAFTNEVNSLYLPTYPEEYDDSFMAPDSTDGHAYVSAEQLDGLITDSENSIHYLVKDGYTPIVRLETTKRMNVPYVDLNLSSLNISADNYKYVTLLVRSDKTPISELTAYYTTDKSTKENKYSVHSIYDATDSWQTVTLNLSAKDSWNGIVDELRLYYLLSGADLDEGVYYDIAGMMFSNTRDAVYDAVSELAAKMYRPVQVVGDFDEVDATYFDNNSAYTGVTASGGNLVYEPAGESSDPSAFLDNYPELAAKKGLKPATTSDFRYIVMRYRSQGITSPSVNLFSLTGTANDLFDMAAIYDRDPVTNSIKKLDCAHCGSASYDGNALNWKSFAIDMAANDGKSIYTNLQYGWYKQNNAEGFDRDTTFKGFRFDWCNSLAQNSYLEISDIVLFNDSVDADHYSALINSVYIPNAEEDAEEETETTQTEVSETLPEFTDTGMGGGGFETLPEFTDTGIVDPPVFETEESIPEVIETEEPVETEGPVETEESSVVETETETSETEESVIEESDSEESFSETEEPTEGSEETESESETETEKNNNGGGVVIPPSTGDLGGVLPPANPSDQKPQGSQVPFYIACGALAALSVASIVVVVIIKIKTRA